MITPWYIAVETFKPSNEEGWAGYVEWSGLSQLKEVVSLDGILCPPAIHSPEGEDWEHNVHEDYMFCFFHDLDYLLKRVAHIMPVNILAVVWNPPHECRDALSNVSFHFKGYDLVDKGVGNSALTNCGGFPLAFRNEELSEVGLIDTFSRVQEVQKYLRDNYPDHPHSDCDIWALWRMESEIESSSQTCSPTL